MPQSADELLRSLEGFPDDGWEDRNPDLHARNVAKVEAWGFEQRQEGRAEGHRDNADALAARREQEAGQ